MFFSFVVLLNVKAVDHNCKIVTRNGSIFITWNKQGLSINYITREQLMGTQMIHFTSSVRQIMDWSSYRKEIQCNDILIWCADIAQSLRGLED